MNESAPVSLLEIIEVIGEADTLKIVNRFGGQRLRLPALRNIDLEQPLAQCIGIDQLTKLVKTTGGGRWMYVARCAQGLRAQRDREIVTLYSPPHNVSVNELASRYNLSYRRIETILSSTVMDDRQVSLF